MDRGGLLRHPLLTAVAAAVISGVIGGAFLLAKGSGGGDVVLIPADQLQANAFVPGTHDPSTPSDNSSVALPNVPDLPGHHIKGDTPGGYGQSGNGVSCDVKALVAYLTDPAHTAQARAWAGVIGIKPNDIRAYFAKLTPLRLRFDTRVTNHDYKDGNANAFQSVLQAGTAVLVDDRGVPRAKCNCGNPLLDPSGSSNTSGDVHKYARNPKDAWPRFNPGKVVTFSASAKPMKEFVTLDLDDGKAYRRRVSSIGTNNFAIDRGDPACSEVGQSTSCGGPGPQATPEDRAAVEQTVRRLAEAVRNRDCNTLVEALSAATLEQLGIGRETLVAGCKEGFRQFDSFGGITIKDVKVVSVNGARAVVSETVVLNGETIVTEDHFVRENGNWKVTL